MDTEKHPRRSLSVKLMPAVFKEEPIPDALSDEQALEFAAGRARYFNRQVVIHGVDAGGLWIFLSAEGIEVTRRPPFIESERHRRKIKRAVVDG
jgi:hypothetical protein